MTAAAPALDNSAQITAESGSNLALSFFSLPAEKRRAMSIFYAFCRVVDDIADSTTLSLDEKKSQLGEWREEIRRAYMDKPRTALGGELAGIIRAYLIPPTHLEEILNGVEMDLTVIRYADFAALRQYCYRVASAVGLVSIEIFGYQKKQTVDYAIALGMAFQLTNILRDVKKDASFGRIYLPQDEMRQWNVTDYDILHSRWSQQMQHFLQFQHHRARHYFAKSWRLLSPVDRPNMIAAEIMREVYSGVLEKIRRNQFNVFTGETRLGKLGKAWRVFQARQREKNRAPTPPPPKKVVVLGAGVAGLAAATELVLRGHEVTVLESKNFLGGRAQSFTEAKTGETIDNGQHILMGCYHETLRLLRELGVEDRLLRPGKLRVPYLSGRRNSTLEAANWPAPFHLLGGLLRFEELTGADRRAAIRLCMRLKMGGKPQPEETALAWLKRWKQTKNAIRAVWEPFCLAALNEPVETADAALLATVTQRAFLSGRDDATILLSRVGLSDLFAPEVEKLLIMCGSRLERNKVISRLEFKDDLLVEIGTQDGSSYRADQVISTLPWNALRGLLPKGSDLARACGKIEDATIVSVHLWLDRHILSEPFVGFLDSPLHWVFSRDHIEANKELPSYRYALVISGANSLAEKKADEIEKLAVDELHRLLPASCKAEIHHRVIYKSRSATFAATPATEKVRPGTATAWKNFWLAGDWTQTGLPATIEGAAISGRKAAEKVDAT